MYFTLPFLQLICSAMHLALHPIASVVGSLYTIKNSEGEGRNGRSY